MSARGISAAIHRDYHHSLTALPLKSDLRAVPAPTALTILDAAVIDGRTVAFATRADQPRLWITIDDQSDRERPGPTPDGSASRVVGYLTGLLLGRPDLWVCDPAAWEWISGGDVTARIKAAAARVWFDCERTCDG